MPRLIACVASVPELVRRHVPDARGARSVRDGVLNALLADPSAALHEQPRLAQTRGTLGDPFVEQLLELRVQGDVAVGAQLAERHVQPVRRADLDHRIDLQVEELALAQPGAGEELDRQAGERVGVLARCAQQLGRRGVVDEPRQRLIAARDVTGEHQHPRRGVLAIPLAETLEADAQRAEMLGQPDLREPPAADGRPLGEVTLVTLDVVTAQIGDRRDLWHVCGQPGGELAQDRLDADHRRRPQRQAHLLDIALQRRAQLRRDRRPLPRADSGLVSVALARRHVDHAGVKQRRLGTVQSCRQRPHTERMIRVQPTHSRDQLLSAGVELRLGQALRRSACERRDLRHRPPLQLRRLRIEPQLGRDLTKPAVELAMNPRRDLPDPQLARDQILGRRAHAAGDDQPRHQPPVMTADRQLLLKRQTRPPIDADAQQERARRRGDLLARVLPGGLQIGAIRGDHRLDLRVAREAVHDASSPASGSSCASIASAAARYSRSSQSFARCR